MLRSQTSMITHASMRMHKLSRQAYVVARVVVYLRTTSLIYSTCNLTLIPYALDMMPISGVMSAVVEWLKADPHKDTSTDISTINGTNNSSKGGLGCTLSEVRHILQKHGSLLWKPVDSALLPKAHYFLHDLVSSL